MIRVAVLEGRMTGHMHDISCKYDDSECSKGIERKVGNISFEVDYVLEQQGTKLINSESHFLHAEQKIYRVHDCIVENHYHIEPRFNCGLAIHEIVVAGLPNKVECVLDVIRNKLDYYRQFGTEYSLVKDISFDKQLTGETNKDIKLIRKAVN